MNNKILYRMAITYSMKTLWIVKLYSYKTSIIISESENESLTETLSSIKAFPASSFPPEAAYKVAITSPSFTKSPTTLSNIIPAYKSISDSLLTRPAPKASDALPISSASMDDITPYLEALYS